MKSILLTTLMSLFPLLSHALVAPVLTNTSASKNFVLGTDATTALKKWNAAFKVYNVGDFPKAVLELFEGAPKELPMAVAGDFNGDKKEDFAVMGSNGKNEIILVLLAAKNQYDVVVVETNVYKDPATQSLTLETGETQPGLSMYLSLLPSKELQFKAGAAKRDALQIETFNSITRAFYVRGAQAKEYKGLID